MESIELVKRLIDSKLNKWEYLKRLNNDFYFTRITQKEYDTIKAQFTNEDIKEAYGCGHIFSTTYYKKDLQQ